MAGPAGYLTDRAHSSGSTSECEPSLKRPRELQRIENIGLGLTDDAPSHIREPLPTEALALPQQDRWMFAKTRDAQPWLDHCWAATRPGRRSSAEQYAQMRGEGYLSSPGWFPTFPEPKKYYCRKTGSQPGMRLQCPDSGTLRMLVRLSAALAVDTLNVTQGWFFLSLPATVDSPVTEAKELIAFVHSLCSKSSWT